MTTRNFYVEYVLKALEGEDNFPNWNRITYRAHPTVEDAIKHIENGEKIGGYAYYHRVVEVVETVQWSNYPVKSEEKI